MRAFDPFTMTLHLKEHQDLMDGDIFTDVIGGKSVRFKIVEIQNVIRYEDKTKEIVATVRELS